MLRQTHVVAVVASDISGPSDCTALPWLSPQDCENICHSGCHFPLWSERRVKVLPASLMTWYTWVPPTTVLINRQMEQEPQQIEQHFARIGLCQIVQIAKVTSPSASPLCPHPPPKKLTSLIICQAKHYSSWFRSAMLAFHSQSISPLSGPKAASLGLIAQPFVPFVCENGKSIQKSSPMSWSHAELGAWVLQIWNGNQENRRAGPLFFFSNK